MQIYLPSIKTKQGTIAAFDHLMASQDSEESNVLFNCDYNLENLNDRIGGNRALTDIEPADRSCQQFLGYLLSRLGDSSAQCFQDLYVLWKLDGKCQGSFVEIGTAYPDHKNNTWILEQNMGWTGLCVEPNPFFHPLIRLKRKSPLVTKAIYSRPINDLHVKIYQKRSATGGLDIDYEFKDTMPPDATIDMVSVEPIPLVQVLEQQHVDKRFDYLSYDTTGNVDDVFSLAQMFQAGYSPDVITISHAYKSHRPKLLELLIENGYENEFAYLSRWDDWYYHKRLTTN